MATVAMRALVHLLALWASVSVLVVLAVAVAVVAPAALVAQAVQWLARAIRRPPAAP